MKSTVIKAAAVALIIFFFIPSFAVSCAGQSVSLSILDTAKGVSAMGQNTAGNAVMYLLLVLPALVLIVSFIKPLAKWESIVAAVSSVVCVVMLFIAQSAIAARAKEIYASTETEPGFYLTLLAHIAILAMVIYDGVAKGAKKDTAT